MRNEIDMKQYGLSETIEKTAECFEDLIVSRVISQEKGIIGWYLHREKNGEKYRADSIMMSRQNQNIRRWAISLWLTGTKAVEMQ